MNIQRAEDFAAGKMEEARDASEDRALCAFACAGRTKEQNGLVSLRVHFNLRESGTQWAERVYRYPRAGIDNHMAKGSKNPPGNPERVMFFRTSMRGDLRTQISRRS